LISSRIAIELIERFRWVISNTSMETNRTEMARNDSKLISSPSAGPTTLTE
jgi:hypothetical protein